MHDTLALLQQHAFPPMRRRRLRTLQVNLGYKCNQQCVHCHVNAGPHRTELMSAEHVDLVLHFLEAGSVEILDVTGGAPELNPEFRRLVDRTRALGRRVIDRCNLTILEVPGHEDLAKFLADRQVEIIASLPCYLEQNVERQRGAGVFSASLRGLRRLNALGYGDDSGRCRCTWSITRKDPCCRRRRKAWKLTTSASWDAWESALTACTRYATCPSSVLAACWSHVGSLVPTCGCWRITIARENLENVMCRDLLSVDWQGYVYDCDFNQMLGLGLAGGRVHLSGLLGETLEGRPIQVRDHCYGCTAGQGSSCGGALAKSQAS